MLDTVTRGRWEIKRLRYLAMPGRTNCASVTEAPAAHFRFPLPALFRRRRSGLLRQRGGTGAGAWVAGRGPRLGWFIAFFPAVPSLVGQRKLTLPSTPAEGHVGMLTECCASWRQTASGRRRISPSTCC